MILDAHSGLRGLLVNADTGERIRWARWADTGAGEYEAFRIDPEEARRQGIPLRHILYHGRANLRFVSLAGAAPVRRTAPATSTPLAELRREALKGRTVTPVILLPGVTPPECAEPLCHRPATWAVSTEQIVEPEAGPDGQLHERGVIIRQIPLCARHWRPPVSVSLRGVESEVQVSARPD